MDNLGNLAHNELVKRNCDWEPEAFEAFWEAYPKKFGKVAAMRAWDRLRLPASEFPAMMAFVESYKARASCKDVRECDGRNVACEHNGACEYYEERHYARPIVPAERFLLDQPWVR